MVTYLDLPYSPAKTIGSKLLEAIGALARPFVVRRRGARRRFVIVEPFGLGDIVVATSLVAPLRAAHPDASIAIVCDARWESFARRLPGVDEVHAHPFPWGTGRKRVDAPAARALAAFLRRLRARRFDVGIDVRGDVRSQLVLLAAGCPERVGFTDYFGTRLRLHGWLLTHRVPCGRRPRLDELRSLLEGFGVASAGMHLAVGARRGRVPDDGARRLVGVHVGAGWEFRRWPADRWRTLVAALVARGDTDVVLFGAPPERDALLAAAGPHATPRGAVRVEILADSHDLVATIAGLDLLVCLDSAPLHVAVGVETPAVALFGPGDVVRWGHAGAAVEVVHHQERFGCAPCAQLACVHPGASCMTTIGVDEVLAAIERLSDDGVRAADATTARRPLPVRA